MNDIKMEKIIYSKREVIFVNPRHALVIGGTGMLADVSLWLANTGYIVSVIGRTKEKHLHLLEKATNPTFINCLVVDYSNYALLEEQVSGAIKKYGPISLVVSWTPLLKSLEIINTLASKQKNPWALYQVMGSSRYFENNSLVVPDNCKHRSIYLGFIIEGDQSRWLSNSEISQGVIRNIEEDSFESIIGTLHPYERRPSY